MDSSLYASKQMVNNAVEAHVSTKVMDCVFWDTQGVVLADFVHGGHIVNADYYSRLLSNQLRPAICRR